MNGCFLGGGAIRAITIASDEEGGKIAKAVIKYEEDGSVPEHIDVLLWAVIKDEQDRLKASREMVSEKRREAIKKRWSKTIGNTKNKNVSVVIQEDTNDTKRRVEEGNAESIRIVNEFEESKAIKPSKTDEDSDFAMFWDAYGKKIDRPVAYKAFVRAKGKKNFPQMSELLTIIRTWRSTESWSHDDGKYQPYPATWLNHEGWMNPLPKTSGTVLRPRIEEMKENAEFF